MTDQSFQVHRFTRMANFYLVVENNELTLIDTGNRDSLDRIKQKFEKAGHELTQLKRIVVTHAHFDHIANLAALKEATGAKVVAHQAEALYIKGESQLPRPKGITGYIFHIVEPLFQPLPVEVDATLQDGEMVEGTGLRVIHVPGHSPGSICLYHAGAKALFPGDLLINRNWKILGPISFFSSDIDEARRSIGRLLDLEINTIYFSHGGVMKDVKTDAVRSLYDSLKIT